MNGEAFLWAEEAVSGFQPSFLVSSYGFPERRCLQLRSVPCAIRIGFAGNFENDPAVFLDCGRQNGNDFPIGGNIEFRLDGSIGIVDGNDPAAAVFIAVLR